MTFGTLVEQLAADSRLTVREVRSVLAALIAALARDVLEDGQRLRVPALGTFRRARRAARPIRSPTGERMELPAVECVAFRCSSSLRRKAVRQ